MDYRASYPPFRDTKIEGLNYIGSKEWYYITSLDSAMTGFVNWNDIWSPVEYRMGLYKLEGKWIIVYLFAGD